MPATAAATSRRGAAGVSQPAAAAIARLIASASASVPAYPSAGSAKKPHPTEPTIAPRVFQA